MKLENNPVFTKRLGCEEVSLKSFRKLVPNEMPKVTQNISSLEKVLISKLKTGDKQAFTALFSAYYRDLVLFALRIVKDADSAEEIVQDTFVRLWEDRGILNISGSFKGYILTSVKNRCFDWLRHKSIVQKHYENTINSPLQFDYETDSYLLFSELEGMIESILEKMPEEISSVFRLNRYKGLKYHEIASFLNVSERTIEVRIGKALQHLRHHLKDYLRIVLVTVSLSLL